MLISGIGRSFSCSSRSVTGGPENSSSRSSNRSISPKSSSCDENWYILFRDREVDGSDGGNGNDDDGGGGGSEDSHCCELIWEWEWELELELELEGWENWRDDGRTGSCHDHDVSILFQSVHSPHSWRMAEKGDIRMGERRGLWWGGEGEGVVRREGKEDREEGDCVGGLIELVELIELIELIGSVDGWWWWNGFCGVDEQKEEVNEGDCSFKVNVSMEGKVSKRDVVVDIGEKIWMEEVSDFYKWVCWGSDNDSW